MSISIEKMSNLGRRVTINVPAQEIENKYNEKLKKVSKNAKVDGFRPGKVPNQVVEQRFGASIRDEVIGDAIQSSLFEALREQNVQPAGTPLIESVKANVGEPLEYVASFEVFPEIKINELNKINLTKNAVSITDQDIEKTIDSIRKQQANWGTTEQAAKDGDMLNIDFVGTIDDVAFAGGTAQGIRLVLGSNSFIPGFEDQLIGVKASEKRDVTVTFPENYHGKDLAGKKAKFAVTVNNVNVATLPELDTAFLERMGVKDGSVAEFRNNVKLHMQHELDRVVRMKLKEQVFDQLINLNPVEVPNSLIEREVGHLHEQMHANDKGAHDHGAHDHPELEPEARRRVTISLLMGEVIREHDIRPDAEKTRQLIADAAMVYAEPKAVEDYFMNNREQRSRFEAVALEDQVVDLIVSKATVTEKPENYSDFMHVK